MYVLTNGTLYLKSNTETTQQQEQAIMFTSEIKAENFKKNVKRTLQPSQFYVIEYAEINNSNTNVSNVNDNVNNSNSNSDKISFVEHFELGDIDSIIYDFETLMLNIDKRQRYLNDSLAHVNKKIVDIEHKIELEPPLDMYKGYLLYKELHNVRIERREIKDELSKIKYINENSLQDWKSRKASNRISGLNNRQYSPRVLNELFEES